MFFFYNNQISVSASTLFLRGLKDDVFSHSPANFHTQCSRPAQLLRPPQVFVGQYFAFLLFNLTASPASTVLVKCFFCLPSDPPPIVAGGDPNETQRFTQFRLLCLSTMHFFTPPPPNQLIEDVFHEQVRLTSGS